MVQAAIDEIARAFGVPPQRVLRAPDEARGAEGFAAALWTKPAPVSDIVRPGPMSDVALLSFHLDMTFEMDFEVDGRRVFHGRTGPGDVCLIPPGALPAAEVRGDAKVFHIYVARDRLPEFGVAQGSEPRPLFAHLSWLHRDVVGLLDRPARPGTLDAMAVYGRLIDLACALLGSVRPLPGVERLTTYQIRRVERVIEQRHAEPLRVADLAAVLDLSEAHFARAWRNSTGRTPGETLTIHRLDRARRLLSLSDLPVIEIAAEVGYGDPAYFARAFRRLHGCTPTRWRRVSRARRVRTD